MNRTPSTLMLALAAAGFLAQPAAAQDKAQACLAEVERLSSTFLGPGMREIEQEPGARRGSQLTDADKNQIQDIVQQARSAAEGGDADQCVQQLAEARARLRQAGLGSAQPGAPAGIAAESAQGGSTIGRTAEGETGTMTPGQSSGTGGMGGGTAGGMGGGTGAGGSGSSGGQ